MKRSEGMKMPSTESLSAFETFQFALKHLETVYHDALKETVYQNMSTPSSFTLLQSMKKKSINASLKDTNTVRERLFNHQAKNKRAITFVFQMEARVAHGPVAAEGNVHDVGAAFDLFWQLAVLKCADQMTVAVRSVVDVQEVIVGLDAETERRQVWGQNTEQMEIYRLFSMQFTPPEGLVQHK